MKRRWHNIFRADNRSFVLALDHAALMDVSSQGLDDVGRIIEEATEGGVDAILTSFGVAQHFQREIGRAGLILRIDAGPTNLHPHKKIMETLVGTFTIEDAVRVGADGVMCMGFPGLEDEEGMMKMLSHTASECKKWGIVFGAEMIPGGFVKDELLTVSNIAFACRLGAEYGADFVKTPFIEDAESFRKVTEYCYKPVLVLGGSKARNDSELLRMVRDAMDAGVCGVVIGRNIWTHPAINEICSAIADIIHG